MTDDNKAIEAFIDGFTYGTANLLFDEINKRVEEEFGDSVDKDKVKMTIIHKLAFKAITELNIENKKPFELAIQLRDVLEIWLYKKCAEDTLKDIKN